jgi:hypothetical protein
MPFFSFMGNSIGDAEKYAKGNFLSKRQDAEEGKGASDGDRPPSGDNRPLLMENGGVAGVSPAEGVAEDGANAQVIRVFAPAGARGRLPPL